MKAWVPRPGVGFAILKVQDMESQSKEFRLPIGIFCGPASHPIKPHEQLSPSASNCQSWTTGKDLAQGMVGMAEG